MRAFLPSTDPESVEATIDSYRRLAPRVIFGFRRAKRFPYASANRPGRFRFRVSSTAFDE